LETPCLSRRHMRCFSPSERRSIRKELRLKHGR
jgi:hypothetical protein